VVTELADVERFPGLVRGTYRDRQAATDGLEPRVRC
jgi:hypothetical protein